MPKICYMKHRFRKEQLDLVATINKILEVYRAQGFVLTLRQTFLRTRF